MTDDRHHAELVLTDGRFTRPGQREIHGLTENAAAALATPSGFTARGRSPTVALHLAISGRNAALVIGPTETDGRSRNKAAAIVGSRLDDRPAEPGLGSLSAQLDANVVWWQGEPRGVEIAVVTAEDEVHLLARPDRDRLHSEPMREGDRLVVLSRSVAAPPVRLEPLLEMALVDDPSPSAACVWLLDAADDAGAVDLMYACVLRVAGPH